MVIKYEILEILFYLNLIVEKGIYESLINETSVRSNMIKNALRMIKEYNLDGIGKIKFI